MRAGACCTTELHNIVMHFFNKPKLYIYVCRSPLERFEPIAHLLVVQRAAPVGVDHQEQFSNLLHLHI